MAADSDNEMRDFTDSEGEQERWEEKTGTRAGIGLIKVQAVLRTEHLRKGYLPLKCVFLVTFSLSTNHTGPLSEGSTATNWSELGGKFEMNHCLPRCLGRFLSRLSDCLRNDLYNVEPLKKNINCFFFTLKNS